MAKSSSPDRKRSAQKKLVKMLTHLRREGRHGRAATTELAMLAMSWGVDRQSAEGWAATPCPAAGWPWDALTLASGVGSGLRELERFVADVDREVQRGSVSRGAKRKVLRKPRRDALTLKQLSGGKRVANKVQVQRKKPKPQSVPGPVAVVRRSELPRLRGAQKPPRKLDLAPEPANPNRPAGWTTTDWINSKS